MEENGVSYANDRQHVTTGHAPARATFLTESTRLSFPLSSSLCHPLHRLSSSHLSLLSFTLYPPFLSVFSSPASLYPYSSSFVSFFSSRNFQFLSLVCHSCVSSLVLFAIFISQMTFQSILNFCLSMINVCRCWSCNGENVKDRRRRCAEDSPRCRWHYGAMKLFCVFIGFPSSWTFLPGDPGGWDMAICEASGFLLIVLRVCIIRNVWIYYERTAYNSVSRYQSIQKGSNYHSIVLNCKYT